MGYVELSGLGLAPAQKLVAGSRFARPVRAVVKKLPFPASPVRRVIVKSPFVKGVAAVAPKNPLINFRPPSGVGQTQVKVAPVRPVIPAMTTANLIRSNLSLARDAIRKVADARPSIYPAQPMIAPARPVVVPVVPSETVKPVYAPSGAEYKNTQVQIQAGVDPNRPESWVAPAEASGAVLSIKEPVPSAAYAFAPSPEMPTDAEDQATAGRSGSWLQFDPIKVNLPTDQQTGAGVAQAGFPVILWIGLGLLALGMLKGKGR